MNKPVNKSQGPRRTSTKEAVERSVPVRESREKVNVMEILADPYPRNGEDYAIHLFHRSKENRRNVFFTCTGKSMDNDNETAHLIINDNRYQVNIKTGVINSVN